MSRKPPRHACLNCEQADMHKETREVIARVGGLQRTVPDVFGWHCANCGEVEFLDEAGSARYDAALQGLAAEAAAIEREALRAARKRLKLTQRAAAALTGGGHNAFSRYERGEAKPSAAVVNLFRLLDRHPELLDEVRAR